VPEVRRAPVILDNRRITDHAATSWRSARSVVISALCRISLRVQSNELIVA